MENLIFTRGYCLANMTTNKLPSSFNSIKLDDNYYFYYHNWLSCQIVRNGNNWLVIAGTCLDLDSRTSDLSIIGNKLLGLLFKKEKSAFYQALDFLSGTFVLCFSVGDKTEFYTDCCAIKSAFYTRRLGKTVVSSHLEMLPLIFNIDLPLSEIQLKRDSDISYAYGYPGNDTKYSKVFQISPNTYLNINDLSVERYFPRENISHTKVEEVIPKLKEMFELQIDLLSNKHYEKIYLSLTAGLDSRFTLACVRKHWDKFTFFTYNLSGLHKTDIERSKDIAELLELKHHILIDINKDFNPLETIEFDSFNYLINKNTNYMHGRKIAYLYYKILTQENQISSHNILHIRSNLSEIGRLYYGTFAYYWDMTSNRSSHLDKILRAYNPKAQDSKILRKSFNDFINRTQFENIYNYDAFDMFYWEHRMGIWMSQVVIEGDPSFETINLFNCRYLLKMILALPIIDRHKDILFSEVIKMEIPELKDIAVN